MGGKDAVRFLQVTPHGDEQDDATPDSAKGLGQSCSGSGAESVHSGRGSANVAGSGGGREGSPDDPRLTEIVDRWPALDELTRWRLWRLVKQDAPSSLAGPSDTADDASRDE